MNILVTGGAGYIGSHACKSLKIAGFMPICYDNLVYGHKEAVKWGPLVVGDIADRKRLDEVIEEHKPVAVMHFAAYAYVGESVQNPGKYYRNNVAGTLTLLEAMRDHVIDKIIFSSTCATYGIPEMAPINEEHMQRPINPYGASKLMIEKILKDFDIAHSIKSISLRYFNAAGADLDGEIGEAHDPETHLIPLIFDAATGKRQFITVHGDDYDTPDGTCIRDYVHVSELANAHVLALKALINGAHTDSYNLGNGCGVSVLDVISSVEKVTGLNVPYQIGPRRLGDPPILVSDSKRVSRDMGWVPQIKDIELIVNSAWKWYKNQ
jgi:UDP-arabinose 4-epimerase